MTVTVSYENVPMFRGLAFALRDIQNNGAPIDIFSADRRDRIINEHNKQFGTNLHGQQYLYDNQRRPGFNPANPPSRTSHCLRSDGNPIYRNAAGKAIAPGGLIPWYELGIDIADHGKQEDIRRFLQVAHRLGYHFVQPYSSGSERHHVVCAHSPIPTLEHRNQISKNRSVTGSSAVVTKPEVNPARGIDVSNNQSSVDFKKVKGAGYEFAYIKAGEGDWKDPNFIANVEHADAAGLKVGAYQFLRPKTGRTGAQEAKFFIDRLHSAALGKGDLCPVLDVEATTLDRPGTANYVESFLAAMRSAGFNPIIYTGTWFWDPKVGRKIDAPLWIAAYQSNEPKLPIGWDKYVIWQYTDKESVPGVGKCDANRCPDLNVIIQH